MSLDPPVDEEISEEEEVEVASEHPPKKSGRPKKPKPKLRLKKVKE